MSTTSGDLLRPAIHHVTRRFQGNSNFLTYSFSSDTEAGIQNQTELILLRLDAALDLDLQLVSTGDSAKVNIQQFAGVNGIDPITGKGTTIVGQAIPKESSWTIEWSKNSLFPTLEVLVHEWGHVLGLGHPYEDDPFSTLTNTAETVMSYNRNSDAPGKYFTEMDMEALEILWGNETSPPDQRSKWISQFDSNIQQTSLAAGLQKLMDSTSTNQSFIKGVYSSLLNRQLDPGGSTYWNNALSQGMHRRELVDNILLSEEFLTLLHA